MKFALSFLLGLTAGVLAQEPPTPAPPVPATPGEEATAPPSVPEPVPAVTEVQPGETPAITPIKGRRVDPIRSLLRLMIRSTRLTFLRLRQPSFMRISAESVSL